MCDFRDRARANHDSCLLPENRTEEIWNAGRIVLVVAVSVHDRVGAELKSGVEACHEGICEPTVVGQSQHVVRAAAQRDPVCSIGAAVVYH